MGIIPMSSSLDLALELDALLEIFDRYALANHHPRFGHSRGSIAESFVRISNFELRNDGNSKFAIRNSTFSRYTFFDMADRDDTILDR